jgi:hypothetical protein
MPHFHILELYEGNFREYSSREVWEELTPYLAGADPDGLTLTTATIDVTHIEGTAFYVVPAGDLPGPTAPVATRARTVGIEELRAAMAKLMHK